MVSFKFLYYHIFNKLYKRTLNVINNFRVNNLKQGLRNAQQIQYVIFLHQFKQTVEKSMN